MWNEIIAIIAYIGIFGWATYGFVGRDVNNLKVCLICSSLLSFVLLLQNNILK